MRNISKLKGDIRQTEMKQERERERKRERERERERERKRERQKKRERVLGKSVCERQKELDQTTISSETHERPLLLVVHRTLRQGTSPPTCCTPHSPAGNVPS